MSDDDWKEWLEELLELDEGLSAWEVNFLDSVSHQCVDDHWTPTEAQLDKLKQIARRRGIL